MNGSLSGGIVLSEDSVRRALSHMEEEKAVAWLDGHLANSTRPVLSLAPWILDTDNTVKPLYGKQEGAVKSYNPKKPGRPSHCYHSYFMANTRLALGVEVAAGDQHTGKHVAAGLWQMLETGRGNSGRLLSGVMSRSAPRA